MKSSDVGVNVELVPVVASNNFPVYVGVVPLGTCNSFGNSISRKQDVGAAAELISRGTGD